MKKIIIVFILLSSIFLVACDSISSPSYNKCNDFAKSMVPEKVSFEGYSDKFHSQPTEFGSTAFWSGKNKWNDGTEMIYKAYYKKGSVSGENLNYFYSYNYVTVMPVLVKTNDSIRYTKQIIADNGDILGDTTFGIKAILKPIPNEFYVRPNNCFRDDCLTYSAFQNFSIASYEIVDCTYMEK